jgi:hypothetical protein
MRVFRLDVSFSCWFSHCTYSARHAEQPAYCGVGVFLADKVVGVGDKGSGDIAVDVETLLDVFLEDFQTQEYFP